MVLFIYFYWKNALGWWYLLGVCELSLSLCSPFSYSGKEGWAPAAYLRKMQDGVMAGNQTTETNKPAVQGQVEIIGNLMEISNLLNKKPSNERHSHTQLTPLHTETAPQTHTGTHSLTHIHNTIVIRSRLMLTVTIHTAIETAAALARQLMQLVVV